MRFAHLGSASSPKISAGFLVVILCMMSSLANLSCGLAAFASDRTILAEPIGLAPSLERTIEKAAPKDSDVEPILQSGPLSLSIGGSGWTGDYGASSTTDISAILLGVRYQHDDWRLSATLPYTRITTAGNVFLGIGATPLVVRPQTGQKRRVNEGVGDLTLGVSYLQHISPRLGVDVEWLGALKAPTASSSSHVSTGNFDFSLGAEISRPLGRWIPFASAVYRDFGNFQTIRLKNGPATSIGASYVISPSLVANFSYDFAKSASRFVEDSHEIVASASYKFSRTSLRLSSYASAGLSSGAAKISGGLSLGRSF